MLKTIWSGRALVAALAVICVTVARVDDRAQDPAPALVPSPVALTGGPAAAVPVGMVSRARGLGMIAAATEAVKEAAKEAGIEAAIGQTGVTGVTDVTEVIEVTGAALKGRARIGARENPGPAAPGGLQIGVLQIGVLGARKVRVEAIAVEGKILQALGAVHVTVDHKPRHHAARDLG